ncbi:MAG: hypothetical protein KDA61_06445, partial [Planctomycetales bacterium]|nr:hypothetical protein [Planctomycetales bacterium]
EFLTKVSEDDRLKSLALETLRRDLLTRAKDFYELVIEQAEEGDDQLHAQRANALQRLADISASIGEYDAAIDAYREAVALFEADGIEEAESYDYAVLLNDLALAYDGAGKKFQAAQLWQRLIDSVAQLRETQPERAEFASLYATSCLNLALVRTVAAPLEAIKLLDGAEAACRQAILLAPDDDEYQETLALIHNNRANALIAREEFESAAGALDVAEGIWTGLRSRVEGIVADELDDRLATLTLNQAIVAASRGDAERAAVLLARGVRMRKGIADRHPDVVQWQSRLAELRVTAAMHFRSLAQYDRSLAELATALGAFHSLREANPAVPSYGERLADAHLEHGLTLLAVGRIGDALQEMQAAVDEATRLVEDFGSGGNERQSNSLRTYRRIRASSRFWRGAALVDAARPEDAAEELAAALAEMEDLLGEDESDLQLLMQLADAADSLGAIYGPQLLDDEDEAQRWRRRAMRATERILSDAYAERRPASMQLEALKIQASVESGLELYEEALRDWRLARDMLAGEPDFLLDMGEATTLFQMQRFDEALDLARKGANAHPHGAFAFAAARELAFGVKALGAMGLAIAERNRLQESFGAAAVELLERARELGYFESQSAVEFLDQDEYLRPLVERDDFRRFVESFERP